MMFSFVILNFISLGVTLYYEWRLKHDSRLRPRTQPMKSIYWVHDLLMYTVWISIGLWIWVTLSYSNYLQDCLGEVRPYFPSETFTKCPRLYGYGSNNDGHAWSELFITVILVISMPFSALVSMVQVSTGIAANPAMKRVRVMGLIVCLLSLYFLYIRLSWLRFPAFFPEPPPFA
jgi:hypothetical protein